ncbi:type II and III secretion system protein family protein [Noviherbaspirillum sp. CPCC 100848]|uniref:Type II and III secretion system protein family protein n=1 Tax=Noviherbaspirillum album TaxID=3080276 RepID=A0ABU6J2W4_9BURK|nr:type II and III secretion system protein family protein [Noviherbaspirillum sp. CPCC 100848]MEC4717771.1 type II and III secretion system protein family protein [Noviherbaspirillum sp. CPCC 100848]
MTEMNQMFARPMPHHGGGLFRQCIAAVAVAAMAGLAHAAPAQSAADAEAGKAKREEAGTAKAAANAGAKAGIHAKSAAASVPVCKGEFPQAANLRVAEGKSTRIDLSALKLPSPAWLRAVADPEIVQIEPLTSAAARGMFFVFGKKVGSTNLMFQDKGGRCAMVEVAVGVDTAAVRDSLRELMPAEKDIKVSAAADSLVISGTATDAAAVDRILTIANAFVRKGGNDAGTAGGNGTERIVNMMSVGAPQQVMLEVKVAEISKTLLDHLGVGLNATANKGSWTLGLLSKLGGAGNGGVRLDKGGDGFMQIDAERRNGLVKILAEPTVMAISGQDGSFLAGGRIFIPVAQDANGKVTLEEKEFGVGLRFTPTVLEGGRINLKVSPEVSELSREGVGISSSGTGGNAVLPLITTRRAATTVQLFDGQSFAIGGLIKSNMITSVKALPVLGELPVLGPLFRSSDFQTDKTELVFIVTPRLVKPLPQTFPLPTDHLVEPSREEFFLQGRMEGQQAQATAENKPAKAAAHPTGFEIK